MKPNHSDHPLVAVCSVGHRTALDMDLTKESKYTSNFLSNSYPTDVCPRGNFLLSLVLINYVML